MKIKPQKINIKMTTREAERLVQAIEKSDLLKIPPNKESAINNLLTGLVKVLPKDDINE